jgi:hypothetical protein
MISKPSFVGDFASTPDRSVRGVRAFLAGRPADSFSDCIKELRKRFGKQLWLATVAGCTDAAVSFWESGKRVPNEITFSRVVDGLRQAGADPGELAALRRSWLEAKSRQCEAKVRRCA